MRRRDARAVRRRGGYVSSDLERHAEWLRALAALGFDEIALHHVGQDLDAFIDAFGEHVLPVLR